MNLNNFKWTYLSWLVKKPCKNQSIDLYLKIGRTRAQ